MSNLTPEDVKLLVEQQLTQITDVTVRDALSALLIDPSCHDRKWDYGGPNETFPCWSVAVHKESGTLYVYCEEGFGPVSPWGIVGLSDNFMGADSGWFGSLERAFYDSFAAAPLPIWKVVKNRAADDVREIATDLTDAEAQNLINQLNIQDNVPNPAHNRSVYSAEPRTKKWW